jgi:hypothetical protein
MTRTTSLPNLEAKNPFRRGWFGGFWKWGYQTRAQNELALLLELDNSDVNYVADSAVLPAGSALHNACQRSALLQWQFESRLSAAKRQPL